MRRSPAFILMPILCRDWAFSKYYSATEKDMLARAIDLNQQRARVAQDYLETIDANLTLQMYKEKLDEATDVDLAIGVLTVHRTHPTHTIQYLTQVMSVMDHLIKKDNCFKEKVLFVCNVHAGPGRHKEAEKLSKFFPMHNRFPDLRPAGVNKNKYEKEKQDYMYCLGEALHYQPEYILIIQDDAIPHADMFDVLSYLLTDMVEYRYQRGNHILNTKPWAFIKLYYPEKWQGYSFEFRHIIELLSIGALGGSVSLILYYSILKYQSRKLGMKGGVIFLIGAVYFILLVWLVGRPYFVTWRHLFKCTHTVVHAPECCIPAVLYNSDMAVQISSFLNQTKCSKDLPVDVAMDKFAKKYDYKPYLVEPNIVHHIGLFSSIKHQQLRPQDFVFDSR